jgi:hypothetical protein
MFRRIVTAVALAALTFTVSVRAPGPTLAIDVGDVILTATLDGLPIDPRLAGDHFCHDFAYPEIRCFRSAARLEAALDGQAGGEGTKAMAAEVRYMTIYDYMSFAGGYAYVSQDYDGLWAIGWNDKISSYRVHNSQSGQMFTDWYASGAIRNFCCNSQVAS